MNWFMTFRIALKALNRNKIRSILTMLGIIIGVGAVIAMVSLGKGAQHQIQEEIASMGTNTLMVWTGTTRNWGIRGGAGTMNTLTVDDFEAILRECPTVKMVSPSANSMAQVVFGNQNWNSRIEGFNEQLPALRNWKVSQGSFFDESHVKTAARVAVLGQTVVTQLFDGADPVGQTIRIRNLPFQVIGVLEKKGFNAFGRDQDDTIIVPFTTVQKKFQTSVQYVQSGIVGAVSARATYAAQEQITELLRQRHHVGPTQDNDFTVRNLSEVAEAAECHESDSYWTARKYRRCFAARWRNWDHEHHAGCRHRANSRDRHTHGHRSSPQPRPNPISDRVDCTVYIGWDCSD